MDTKIASFGTKVFSSPGIFHISSHFKPVFSRGRAVMSSFDRKGCQLRLQFIRLSWGHRAGKMVLGGQGWVKGSGGGVGYP